MKNNKNYSIRVLHVVGGMNRGGVETWLMHVLRNLDRKRFSFDFLVHTTQPCAYDEEIRELGSKIIPCLHPSRPWQFSVNFRRLIKEHGPYDVVHSHVHHYSGFVLRLARKLRVPMRIAHSHNDTSSSDSSADAIRKAYLRLMEYQIREHATLGLAASGKASSSLYGPEWKKDHRWRILHCGVELQPFAGTVDRYEIRSELGLSPDAFVIGHVGSFSRQKNHEFLVDIAAELVKRDSKTRLLLIGDGPLRPVIEEKVAILGMKEQVLFAGLRDDVPRLMLGTMDVFILPSHYEGMPLVSIEAQAANLPCVFSDSITKEADVVLPLIHRVSLKKNANIWADIVFETRGKSLITKNQALETIIRSSFNIMSSVEKLKEVYESES
jgi:glycosyltransferase involved in cell wall biosynthesis